MGAPAGREGALRRGGRSPRPRLLCLGHPGSAAVLPLALACSPAQARICLPFRKSGYGPVAPFSSHLTLALSLQTRGEMRKNHRLVSHLGGLGKESPRGSRTFPDPVPLLWGRKLASSTSSMQSSCTWRRRPLSTCSRPSTCPTRMPASAWAASAWRAMPTPSRSANSPVLPCG